MKPIDAVESVQPARPADLDDVGLGRAIWVAGWMVVVLAGAIGVVLRAWYLTHQPVSADEAIVGLMAKQILHVHFGAFYWGQSYGGVEPYVVAGVFALFGAGTIAMKLTVVALSALAVVLVVRIVRRLVDDPLLAWLAGALVWVAPAAGVSYSTYVDGFRAVTMACGLGLVLAALRVLDGHNRRSEFVVLGLVFGVGWWSSPEIVYFAIPTSLLLVGAIVADPESRRLRRWSPPAGLIALGTVVGALPWLWANIGSGFKSISRSSISVPPGAPGYWGRLENFFRYSFSMLGDLRVELTGWRIGSVLFGPLLIALATLLVGLTFLSWTGGGRKRAFVVAVVAFPFVMALSPATWYWEDGRYTIYVFPLITIVAAVGAGEMGAIVRKRRRTAPASRYSELLLTTMVACALVAGTICFVKYNHYRDPRASLVHGWNDPNGPSLAVVATLERNGVRAGYADYWVAYRMDLLSGERLSLTPIAPDVLRSTTLSRAVANSKRPAWIFVPSPTPGSTAENQFALTDMIQGPGGLSERAFLANLHRIGVGYRIVHADFVQAVIPVRSVGPDQVSFQTHG